MVCLNCSSTDLKRVSLIHAAAVYQSRGRFRGFLFGGTDGALFGRYRGVTQSGLSALANPPRKAPYVGPIILWLIGFFILMSFDAQGKLSWEMAVLSVMYILALPVYLLGSLVYNFVFRPKKLKNWERKFMCQRCGAIIEDESSGAEVRVRGSKAYAVSKRAGPGP
jgi:hypothetical protein